MSIQYNTIQREGWQVEIPVSDPASPVQFDPVRFGSVTGIAMENEGIRTQLPTNTLVYFGPCQGDFSVRAVNDGGNSAIVPGDVLYYVDADSPKLSKKSTAGVLFGVALSDVTAGATATILVFKLAAGLK